jgi:hypothetical protein
MGAAPAAGEYRTDGVSLIYVDAVLDDPNLADKPGNRETICVVEVDSSRGVELMEMPIADVEKLAPVNRG